MTTFFNHIIVLTRYVNPELKQKIKKLLSVWKERKVYGSEFIDLLEKKAQLITIQASSSLPNDMSHTSEIEEDEENAKESDQSFSLPPILKDLSENMKALHENDASKVSAITRVNAIRSKLYQKEDFYSIHGKLIPLSSIIYLHDSRKGTIRSHCW